MKTKIFIAAISIFTGFISCQKTDYLNQNPSTDDVLKSTEINVSDLRVEGIAQESGYEADFFSNSEQLLRQLAHLKGRNGRLMEKRQGLRYQIGQCPNVSIDTASTGYPITITLNYGDSTKLQNGRVMSGIITIEISGPKFTDGTTRTVKYSNFVVDSITVEGSINEHFIGDNVSARKISENGDLSFSLPDGTVINRVSNRVHKWLAGIDTPLDYSDDKIEITGNVNVTSSNGQSYSKTIVDPLIRFGDCPYFVQGKTQLTLNGTLTSDVDFGNGECDNKATLTTNGEIITIDLSGRMPKANWVAKSKGKKGKG